MLKPSLSASSSVASQESSESTGSGESSPHLLLLQNRCQLEDFTPDSVTIMQDLYRFVLFELIYWKLALNTQGPSSLSEEPKATFLNKGADYRHIGIVNNIYHYSAIQSVAI